MLTRSHGGKGSLAFPLDINFDRGRHIKLFSSKIAEMPSIRCDFTQGCCFFIFLHLPKSMLATYYVACSFSLHRHNQRVEKASLSVKFVV